ncbi:MAG TPA: hypothetical protein VIY29_09380 [Ktedonobacteraceae bacterium]
MSKRKHISFWLAWFALVLYLVITLLSELLTLKNAPSELLSGYFYDLVLLVFMTVGAFIASRRPENPIGWIICASTLIWALSILALEYGVYSLITMTGTLPGGALVDLFGAVGRGIGWFLVMTFLLLLFPNGHLPSSRWRPLTWFIAGLLTANTITLLLDPTPFINLDSRLATVPNPLRISGASALFDQINSLLGLVLLASVLPCIASVIVRFRRSKGDERQQLKWMAFGMMLSLFIIVTIIVFTFTNINTGPLAGTLFYLPVLTITISAGIAMLKYRLYDIDVIINRTIVYGSLSALAACRREQGSGHISRSESARILHTTGRSDSMELTSRQNTVSQSVLFGLEGCRCPSTTPR